MKYMGAVLVCAAGILMGLSYSMNRRKHIEALKSLCTALEIMKYELRTRLLSMPELCGFIKGRLKGTAGEFFKELEKKLSELGEESFFDIWSNAAESSFDILSAEELRELKLLGNALGRTGLEEESEAIEICLGYMQNEYDRARQAYPAEKKLGLGLGASAAALLVLVLI